METVQEVPTSDVARLKASIISLINDRGEDADKLSCLIGMIFDRYQGSEQKPLPAYSIWKRCWAKDERAALPSDRAEDYRLRLRVRTAVQRAKLKINDYFKTPAGRNELFKPSIERGTYRLVFHLNSSPQTDRTGDMQVESDTTIGLLCALRSNWFNSELIAGAEKAARAYPFRIVVAYSDGDLQEEAEQLQALSAQCSAVVVVPILDEYSREAKDLHRPFLSLIEKKHPVVFVDRRVPGCDAPLVGCDNTRGGLLAIEYLVRECGCTRTLIIGESGSSAARERVQACEDYLRDADGRITPEVEWIDIPEERGGYEYMSRLLASAEGQALLDQLASGTRVGLFATNDALIRGVRAFLDSPNAPKLPAPLHMVGFDGREFGHFMHPPLVSIKQDFYEIGRSAVAAAVELIKRRDANHKVGPVADLSKKTQVQLLRRDSPWPEA